jgi:hypothetical protein
MRPEGASHPGWQFTRQNKDGADAHYVVVEGVAGWVPSSNGNGKHGVEPADPGTRHAVYTALLDALSLSPDHHAALLSRGFTGQQIAEGQYRTLPPGARRPIASEVVGRTNLAVDEVLKVPGFARDDQGDVVVMGQPGLLIPVMDPAGTIGACRIRPDNPVMMIDPDGQPKPVSKYVWLSSRTAKGPGAVCSAHVPPGSAGGDVVRLTEGELKAHLASARSGLATISIPGANSWRHALPTLRAMGAKAARLALDADSATNPNVAGAQLRALRGLVADGYEVEVECWDPSQGKGIDDVLVAGGTTRTSAGLNALHQVLVLARQHKVTTTIERDQVVPWVEWYLSRKLEVELMQDRDVLAAAGTLEAHDPARRAELAALLKRHKQSVRDFLKAAKHEARGGKKAVAPDLPYVERDGCTYVIHTDREGNLVERLLADFTARIVREIERHEASETRLQFEIEATHRDGATATATVDAERYSRMEWVGSLGSVFTIASGAGTKDQLREAIQLFSHVNSTIPRVTVYTSLGWQEHEGLLVYLHAGGGIGPDGPVPVNIDPPSVLNRYVLPEPPADPKVLTAAVKACVEILDLGKASRQGARAMAAVAAALPFRAVLAGPFDSTPHFSGMHHSRKTSVGKLLVHHFCYGADDRTIVSTTWESSAKSLQRHVFDARDSLLLVDELTGEKALETASQVIQAQGNLRAGTRLTSTRDFAATFDPRGSILSTGETDPRRQSTLGRMLKIGFTKDTVDLAVLTRLQEHAAKGLFALAMSRYIQWLAQPWRLESERNYFWKGVHELVDRERTVDPAVHVRQLTAAAEMACAYRSFMGFAAQNWVLLEVTAKATGDTVETYLLELVRDQKQGQEESEPAERFLCLLRAGLLSGRYHLRHVDPGDEAPEPYAEASGWKKDWLFVGGTTPQRLDWVVPANSKQIGYIDPDAHVVCLDPEMAKVVARTMSQEQGAPYENVDQIARDLGIAGISEIAMQAGKTRYTIFMRIRGISMRVIKIPTNKAFGGP